MVDGSSLLSQLARGEDSTNQFKVNVKNAGSLASEVAAFANTSGCVALSGHVDPINDLLSMEPGHE